jgi:hypothetical protein
MRERERKRGRRTSALVVRDFKISSPLRLSWKRGAAPPQFHASSVLKPHRHTTAPLLVASGCVVSCAFTGGTTMSERKRRKSQRTRDDVVEWDGGLMRVHVRIRSKKQSKPVCPRQPWALLSVSAPVQIARRHFQSSLPTRRTLYTHPTSSRSRGTQFTFTGTCRVPCPTLIRRVTGFSDPFGTCSPD